MKKKNKQTNKKQRPQTSKTQKPPEFFNTPKEADGMK